MADQGHDAFLAPKIRDLFFRQGPGGQAIYIPSRYKVAHGGRGGAKSWGFGRTLVTLGSMRKLRVLCARELQASIQDSVHKLLADQIDALGLSRWYDVQQRVIRSTCGTEIIFEGLAHNVTKIKSMEGIDIVWVEEAEKVSNSSWEVLIPTIRKKASEIWVTFNPNDDDDPTNQRFVVNPPPNARVVEINWPDNPWFPEELRAEKDYLYRVDPDAAEHVWGGKTRKVTNAQVLRGKYVIDVFEPVTGNADPEKNWDGPYFGADWGFATDPTAAVKLWIKDRRLYVEYEAYGVGVEIDATPALFDKIPDARKYIMRGDSARPETISYLQRHGYGRLYSVEKWPGSVEDGIAFLRSFETIVIHPRCVNTQHEARLWSYKTDKLTGDVLPVVLDAHNHIWDAVRYALQPLIRNKNTGLLAFYAEEAAKAKREKENAHG